MRHSLVPAHLIDHVQCAIISHRGGLSHSPSRVTVRLNVNSHVLEGKLYMSQWAKPFANQRVDRSTAAYRLLRLCSP